MPHHCAATAALGHPSLRFKLMKTTDFFGLKTLLATKRPGMAHWRERLFAFLYRRQPSAAKLFHLPPDRVVEVEDRIEL